MLAILRPVATDDAHTPVRRQDLRKAFDACYTEHRQQVFQWLLRYEPGRAGWAEDMTHDVFVSLWEHFADIELEDIGAWLYRVSANLAISRLRRERSRLRWLRLTERVVPRTGGPTPAQLLEQREAHEAVVATLQALAARERVVMTMKILDGKSQREIASTLELSEGYVSKIVNRACKKIRAAGWRIDDEPT